MPIGFSRYVLCANESHCVALSCTVLHIVIHRCTLREPHCCVLLPLFPTQTLYLAGRITPTRQARRHPILAFPRPILAFPRPILAFLLPLPGRLHFARHRFALRSGCIYRWHHPDSQFGRQFCDVGRRFSAESARGCAGDVGRRLAFTHGRGQWRLGRRIGPFQMLGSRARGALRLLRRGRNEAVADEL